MLVGILIPSLAFFLYVLTGQPDALAPRDTHGDASMTAEQVEQVVVTDAFPDAARRLADEQGYEFAPDLDSLLGVVDALVITTSTDAHAATLRRGIAAGLPTFCEFVDFIGLPQVREAEQRYAT